MRRSKLKTPAALVLALLLSASIIAPALAEGGTSYYIGSAEQLLELSEKCSLDSWSRDVTVVLTADIDLTGVDFAAIPIFGGVFEGNGHTISGLVIDYSASHVGLFRYIEAGGVVRGLNVKGRITPSGSAQYVGGIAGNNSGTVKDCSFTGQVMGTTSVGGIAGANEQGGLIENCTVAGYIGGEHYTGGAVGQNLGRVVSVRSAASVNTAASENSFDIEQIDLSKINSTENFPDYTDTGGIAGYSSGVLERCINTGGIGYDHVGYNVGGIAGRQAGYIFYCENRGAVTGRKEVGGIAGQMEPYLTIDPSAATTANLKTALVSLHDLLDVTLKNAQGSSDAITARLVAVSDSMGAASEDMSYITGETVDFVDDTMQAGNEIIERVDYVIDSLPDILEQLRLASAGLGVALDDLGRVNEDLAIFKKMEAGSYDETAYALLSLTAGTGGSLRADSTNPAAGQEVIIDVFPDKGYALSYIEAADADGERVELIDNGDGSFSFIMPTLTGDPETDPVGARAKNTVVRAEFEPTEDYAGRLVLSSGYGGYLSTPDTDPAAGTSVEIEVRTEKGYELRELYAYVEKLDGTEERVGLSRINDVGTRYGFSMPSTEVEERVWVRAEFKRGSDMSVVSGASDRLDAAMDDLNTASSLVSGDMATLRDILNSRDPDADDIEEALVSLVTNGAAAGDALSRAIEASSLIMSVTSPYVTEAARLLNEDLGLAISHMREASNYLTDALSLTRSMFSYLGDLPDVRLPQLGSEYRRRMDSLCGNLSDMAEGLGALGRELGNAGTALVSDLRSVNDQFKVVAMLLVDAMAGIAGSGIEDMFTDISESEDGSTDGLVSGCENKGEITGDVNVGGIAGAMAIEYDFDPESDVTGAKGLQSYLSRCVLAGCTNRGSVSAKKDGAGGIVGQMELGSLISCLSLGDTESRSGDYVGGIAGRSFTAISDCWAMCRLAGDDYVGGIAGGGTRVYNCRSLVEITAADECAGAVAGCMEENADLLGNLFASDTLRGVDGISYSGKAEPVSYKRLAALPDAPQELKSMSVSFCAEDEVVAVIAYEYGGSIDAEEIPEVPDKPGYHGSWEEFDREHMTLSRRVEAVYVSYGTALESAELTRIDGSPVLLAEGSFLPEAKLTAQVEEDIELPAYDGQHPLEAIKLNIEGDAVKTDEHRLRYCLPETARSLSKIALYVREAGHWRRVSYESVGKYAVFTANGDELIIYAAEQPVSNKTLYLTAAAAITATSLLAAALITTRRKTRKTGKHEKIKAGE